MQITAKIAQSVQYRYAHILIRSKKETTQFSQELL